jgi:hypothetical protein
VSANAQVYHALASVPAVCSCLSRRHGPFGVGVRANDGVVSRQTQVSGLLELVGPALLLGPCIGVCTGVLLKDSKVGAGLDNLMLAKSLIFGTRLSVLHKATKIDT